MRDSNRITPTLEAIEKLWRTVPELRLGQLMWMIAEGDTFNMEDDETVRRAEERTGK